LGELIFCILVLGTGKADDMQCAKWGVEADLIRFSVGLEETGKLVETFKRALEAIPQ
jgi:cystathionine beta-lyase/cystathionine gamma-synthase